MSTWIMGDDGYPTNTDFISLPDSNTSPLPYGKWRNTEGINDGYPYTLLLNELPESDTEPLPKGKWRCDAHYNEGFPYHELLLDVPMDYGAFENSDIERVRVPISVKTIGAYAFSNTKLRHVRIAADATISSTSVPEGCIVTRYPDDRYEQLTDEQGRMVLDRDARRILLRRIDD